MTKNVRVHVARPLTVDPRDWDRLYRCYQFGPVRVTRSATWDNHRPIFGAYRDRAGGVHIRWDWWMLHIGRVR